MQLKTKIILIPLFSLFFIFPLFANGATTDKSQYRLEQNPIISYESFYETSDTAVFVFQDGFYWGFCEAETGFQTALIENEDFCLDEEGTGAIPFSLFTTGNYQIVELDNPAGSLIICNDLSTVGFMATITPQACIDYIVGQGGNSISSFFTLAITGLRFVSIGTRDTTGTTLSANVTDSVGSVFPIVLLSISVFLAFYIIQRLAFMFGGVETATVRKRGRRGKRE